jgi:hypothetical protein
MVKFILLSWRNYDDTTEPGHENLRSMPMTNTLKGFPVLIVKMKPYPMKERIDRFKKLNKQI